MTSYKELLEIANQLENLGEFEQFSKAEAKLNALEDAAIEVGKAFSGSWQGYHANVYYRNLVSPPPGTHFSQEWGLMDTYGCHGTIGDWVEYDEEELIELIHKRAGNPKLDTIIDQAKKVSDHFEDAKSKITSILITEDSDCSDSFLKDLRDQLETLVSLSAEEILSEWLPKRQIMTRDTVIIGQGSKVPPHIRVKAKCAWIRQPFFIAKETSKIARKAGSHIERKAQRKTREERIGTNIFIGHGRSQAWRELKDFVQDRLHLPYDEFNRTPVAGITNQARLVEMLNAATLAFIIMTAEDETAEGAMQARMNVIHEVGLFQGRLGFTRAIVLLEEGCEEFSNIQGVGQIRFPRGKISACFEEVRRVLEREGIISG